MGCLDIFQRYLKADVSFSFCAITVYIIYVWYYELKPQNEAWQAVPKLWISLEF